MNGVIIIIALGVVALLVGFIILQRRKPDAADKIASSLDASVKSAEQKAKDAIDQGAKKL